MPVLRTFIVLFVAADAVKYNLAVLSIILKSEVNAPKLPPLPTPPVLTSPYSVEYTVPTLSVIKINPK